jgi:CRISPR-associated protein Csh1
VSRSLMPTGGQFVPPSRRIPLIKEIVEFSKKLQESGIYDKIEENLKFIDRPVMVIPLKDDLTEILADEIYFVFKRVEGDDFYIEEKGKEKQIKLNSTDPAPFRCKSLHDEDKQWQEILKSLSLYTTKLAADPKGNKSIGGNKGTNSYHLLIFEGKVKGGIFGEDRNGFEDKMSRTYEKKTIEKGLPESTEENEKAQLQFIALLEKVKEPLVLDKIWSEIEQLKKAFVALNKKTGSPELPFDSIFVVFKLPGKYRGKNNLYKEWYDKYLRKKIFKVDNLDAYYKAQCGICGAAEVDTYLPDCFNNLDAGKPFLQHNQRNLSINTAICGDCALEIYKFQDYFLNRLRMTIFPLFIHPGLRERTINLFRVQDTIDKLSFKEIITGIYRESSQEELDFYLVFYKRKTQKDKEGILFFDYITGFHYRIKTADVFKLETDLDHYFFDGNLGDNYFTSKVETENRRRDHLVYSYRQVVFDFVYRAKYNSLDRWVLQDMYVLVLERQLKQLVSKDRNIKDKNLKESFQHYLELDKLFMGVIMDTIKKIQESQTIRDKESFAYYAGQIAYYLLSQSKSESKTHALVEPFINATGFSALGIRLEELFNNYKHALAFNYGKFNSVFTAWWAFLYDHKEEPFSKELKILFYAGYFNSEGNIFYQPGKKEE